MSFVGLIVRVSHLLIVLFVILIPFQSFDNKLTNLCLAFFHFLFVILLLIHWWYSSDICSLTLLESKITGNHIGDGFIHSIIAPFYNLDGIDDDVENYIIYTFTIFLGLMSLNTIVKNWRDVKQILNIIGKLLCSTLN